MCEEIQRNGNDGTPAAGMLRTCRGRRHVAESLREISRINALRRTAFPETIGEEAILHTAHLITARSCLPEKVRPFSSRRRGDLISSRKL